MIITGEIIIPGSFEPVDALIAIIFDGISVREAVLITINRIISEEGTSFSPFSFDSSFIALRPKGVAAFPSPSKLDAIFIVIAPTAGCPFGIEGKRRQIRGERNLDSLSVRPESFAISIIPSHKLIVPIRLRDNSTAFPEYETAASNISRSLPFTRPSKMPNAKRKNQI